ncbi:MAG TPA: hypothetical protein VHZ03_57805 [Trebonia sp.]|jgi:hypothetical protein|nr:hypothetical protein [Trebonia sp.]
MPPRSTVLAVPAFRRPLGLQRAGNVGRGEPIAIEDMDRRAI